MDGTSLYYIDVKHYWHSVDGDSVLLKYNTFGSGARKLTTRMRFSYVKNYSSTVCRLKSVGCC